MAILLPAVGLLGLLAYGFRTDPRAVPSPLVGRPAAPFSLALFDGTRPARAASGQDRRYGWRRAAAARGRPNAASRSVTVRSAAQSAVTALLALGASLSYAQPSPPLRNLVDDQIVSKVGYCRGEYALTMANGARHTYSEFNLRFKTDGSRLGPDPGSQRCCRRACVAIVPRSSLRGSRTSSAFWSSSAERDG